MFDLYATQDSSEIVVHAGKVEVKSKYGNQFFSPGQVYRSDRESGGDFQSTPSVDLRRAAKELVAGIGAKQTGGANRSKYAHPNRLSRNQRVCKRRKDTTLKRLLVGATDGPTRPSAVWFRRKPFHR